MKPHNKHSLNSRLRFVLVSSSASVMMLAPMLVSASVFSIPAFLSSLMHETAASGGVQNSQTLAILSPATNLDPRSAVGGGDIMLVGGTALLPQEGPSGTAADIENALPEATAISVYTVHKGDTLGEVAKMYGVTTNTILWANDLKSGTIREGQELVILPVTGLRYTVQKGDTLASLAKKYNADEDEIAKYNDINGALSAGMSIIIPDGEIALSAPVRNTSTSRTSPLRGAGGMALSGYYSWPVAGGVLTQGLHGYNGIDIGAPTGTRILAAAAGTVIIAKGGGGWNGGYGNYVVIQHDNGTQTLYAHMSQVLTTAGARVQQGSAIGNIGSTGKATGPHLHFEVRGAANPFTK